MVILFYFIFFQAIAVPISFVLLYRPSLVYKYIKGQNVGCFPVYFVTGFKINFFVPFLLI